MSLREEIISFCRMPATCASTVRTELCRRLAIALLGQPAAARIATSRSARDKLSHSPDRGGGGGAPGPGAF